MTNTPIIPNDYIIRRSGDQVGGERKLTVRKFRTNQIFEREKILQGLSKGRLVFGAEFGVIDTFDTDNPQRNIRALCGLVGERDLVLVNNQNELDYIRLQNVLLATLMIEFMADPDSNQLEFLIYGGTQGRSQLFGILYDYFKVNPEPIQRSFSDMAVRRLCEKFFNHLYQIKIDPLKQTGWGTISDADFKSKRGEYIDPKVDRMQQVHDNKDIIIQSFKSELRNEIKDQQGHFYNIKFRLLADGGINMIIPAIKTPLRMNNLKNETVVYDLARKGYYHIVGDEELYKAISEEYSGQFRLF